MRQWVRVLLVVVVGLVGYGIGLAQPYVLRPPLVPGQDAITDAASATGTVTVDDVGGPVLSIQPATRAEVLFILYPGGLVRPQAYEWLGRALASEGVHTVIPEFPVDLAVLDAGRADRLVAHYAQGRSVVIGGHSLGGAMAAAWAADHPDAVAGLVLMAAYPPNDSWATSAPFRALVLHAEHDGVADADAVRGALERLPTDTRFEVIPGAVHSFFGRYGPQSGDGVPTVSRADAEASIVTVVGEFLDAI